LSTSFRILSLDVFSLKVAFPFLLTNQIRSYKVDFMVRVTELRSKTVKIEMLRFHPNIILIIN